MNKNLFDLENNVALITGGAGLLATEHAIALASFGARVYLSDNNFEKCKDAVSKLNDLGFNVTALHADVTSKKSWEVLLNLIIKKEGKIDILVNNAGFTNQSKSENFDKNFESFPLEDWNSIINVNLTGTFLGCQVIGRHMLENKKGSIINIASLYGVVSPNHKIYPGTGISQPVAYSISKSGVISLTKYLATLWAEKGVRVNSITPGAFLMVIMVYFFKGLKSLTLSEE